MEYERHHITFISRTMQLLNQYQTSIIGKVPKSEEFEVTLLINCLLGLLIVPNEQCYNKIPLKDFYINYYENYKPTNVKITYFHKLKQKFIYLFLLVLLLFSIYYLYDK